MDAKSPFVHIPDPIYDTRHSSPMRQTAKSPDPMTAVRMQQMRIKNNATPNRMQTKSPYLTVDSNQQDVQNQNLYTCHTRYGAGNKDPVIHAQRFDDYNNRIYGSTTAQGNRELYIQNMAAMAQKYPAEQSVNANHASNAERRTPDTYGRSRPDQMNRTFSDYEDIYNLGQQMNQQDSTGAYRRPLSPPSYNNNKYIPNLPERYTPDHLDVQNQNAQRSVVQHRVRPVLSVPRPHSADFLEYEARHMDASNINPEPIRAPRPKSSLDINRSPDHFYYSEASYAEKMRQSALYLQKPLSTPSQIKTEDFTRHFINGTIYGFKIDSLTIVDCVFYCIFQLVDNNIPSPYLTGSANTVPRESDFDQTSRLEMEALAQQHNMPASTASVPRTHRSYARDQQQEQFLRSASARLPRKDSEAAGARDGERKREESMKRLLEWKQRMLQSPLTRKGVPISIAMDASSPLSQQNAQLALGIQRSRSETHANNGGYNSYSSDDEGEFFYIYSFYVYCFVEFFDNAYIGISVLQTNKTKLDLEIYLLHAIISR